MKLTREELRQRALALFQERGYHNVTIQDICQDCGITKPTFYKYAGSKEELILDLYDRTIRELVTDTYQFVEANTHYEQLLIVFRTLMRDTEKFGSDLFSQMLISNLNENHHSFDMRESLTKLCTMIIRKAQEKGEIRNQNAPGALYQAIAYAFSGYELNWCIHNGDFDWEGQLFETILAVLDVAEELREVHLKYLQAGNTP